MLIVRVLEKEENKKTFKRKRNKLKSFTPYRENFVLNNEVYTVLYIHKKDLYSDDFLKLLKRFKGKVLKTQYTELNEIIGEYLYDVKPYLIRSFLSTLIKILKNETEKKYSVLLISENLETTEELFNLAKMCKALGIKTSKENKLSNFTDFCFCNLGLKVDFSCRNYAFYDVIFNLDEIGESLKAKITFNGDEAIINADCEYFLITDDVKKLIDCSVQHIFACSSVNKNKQKQLVL